MSNHTEEQTSPEGGGKQRSEELLPLVYEELRRLGTSKLAQERPGQTLQATALVHEAWLRLQERHQAAGIAGGTSSPLPPRPCGAFSSTTPVANKPSATAADCTARSGAG